MSKSKDRPMGKIKDKHLSKQGKVSNLGRKDSKGKRR